MCPIWSVASVFFGMLLMRNIPISNLQVRLFLGVCTIWHAAMFLDSFDRLICKYCSSQIQTETVHPRSPGRFYHDYSTAHTAALCFYFLLIALSGLELELNLT